MDSKFWQRIWGLDVFCQGVELPQNGLWTISYEFIWIMKSKILNLEWHDHLICSFQKWDFKPHFPPKGCGHFSNLTHHWSFKPNKWNKVWVNRSISHWQMYWKCPDVQTLIPSLLQNVGILGAKIPQSFHVFYVNN